MGPGYLIDSNTIIDFFNYSLPTNGIDFILTIDPVISIITQIEIFSKKNIDKNELSSLNGFVSIATIYDVNAEIALKTIKLRQAYNIKLADAIIAATAAQYNLTLITRNVSDFGKIKGLKLINPHTI
jgi:predicted nucleic acid-binding protein